MLVFPNSYEEIYGHEHLRTFPEGENIETSKQRKPSKCIEDETRENKKFLSRPKVKDIGVLAVQMKALRKISVQKSACLSTKNIKFSKAEDKRFSLQEKACRRYVFWKLHIKEQHHV